MSESGSGYEAFRWTNDRGMVGYQAGSSWHVTITRVLLVNVAPVAQQDRAALS